MSTIIEKRKKHVSKSKKHVNRINKGKVNEKKRVRAGWRMERRKAEDK